MWPDNLDINVSRESLMQFEMYQALLMKWQKAINLVSPKTLQESGVRHFADSVQLAKYVPESARFVMDWGSGAGFPGAVLSIVKPDIGFTLVESDERKCQFLKAVSRETSATMRVENARIEDVVAACEDIPDLITARALKSVKTLLDYGYPLVEKKPDLRFLLLKGENVDAEFEEAFDKYDFKVERWPSVTNTGSSIILISSIQLKP